MRNWVQYYPSHVRALRQTDTPEGSSPSSSTENPNFSFRYELQFVLGWAVLVQGWAEFSPSSSHTYLVICLHSSGGVGLLLGGVGQIKSDQIRSDDPTCGAKAEELKEEAVGIPVVG